MKLNIQLRFNKNAEKAFEFYKEVFKIDNLSIYRHKDMDVDCPKEIENYIANISLQFGDSFLMGYDDFEVENPDRNKNQDTFVHITPDSKQEAKRIFDELSNGGNILNPIDDMPWGYYGSLIDKFGVGWEIMLDCENTK